MRVLRGQPEGPFVGSDIYVINADRSGRRRLTKSPPQSPGDLDPVWSPDGRQITFVRQFAIGASDIFVVDADGSGLRRLTRSGDADEPVWSPDSRQIAFVRHVTDEAGADIADIFVVNADGNGLRRLTQTPALDQRPAWSPG